MAGSPRGASHRRRGGLSRRIERAPKVLSLAHYDAARDYQTSVQRARRTGAGSRDERIDMPAVLNAGTAKALAEALLRRAETEREQRIVALPADMAGIAPGTLVSIDGEAGRWRVTEAALEAMVTTLTCVRVAPPGPVTSATPGRALPAPDLVAGTTILHVAELPALGDSPNGRAAPVGDRERDRGRMAAREHSLQPR